MERLPRRRTRGIEKPRKGRGYIGHRIPLSTFTWQTTGAKIATTLICC
jgi:hypothetical protein